MEIINGNKKLAGASIGEAVNIHLITGKIEKVILTSIDKVGIEGLEANLSNQPLTFYPFTAIVKIKKFTEIT